MRERYHRAQNPVQLGYLRNVALAKKDCPGGIEAKREKRERCLEHRGSQDLGFANGGHRMQIGDEVEALAFVLKPAELADCAAVVAQVPISPNPAPRATALAHAPTSS